jgi:glycosyltransferase involved in cell wall biosynthesis
VNEVKSTLENDWLATVAILGARMHYAVPAVLASNDRLERFYTDWYLHDSGVQGYIRKILLRSPIKFMRRAGMRHESDLPDNFVYSFHLMGLAYETLLSITSKEEDKEYLYLLFGKLFNWLSKRHGFGKATIIYGMNSACLEWFRLAKRTGISCILEQCSTPHPIYYRLASEEYRLWPGWEREITPRRNHYLNKREAEEWNLANLIICGSEFVAEGLMNQGVSKEKCLVVPYSVKIENYFSKEYLSTPKDRKLKILFLGGIRIMKGIQYLTQALQTIGSDRVQAKAAGGILLRHRIVANLQTHMDVLGLVPRSEVPNLLAWADVLVLPSICEGSALVTYEALAAGVPVITTPNAGSPVVDGVTGFIVPIRDASAIAEKLETFIEKPELLQDMSVAARKYAIEHLSFQAYSKRLITALDMIVKEDNGTLVN